VACELGQPACIPLTVVQVANVSATEQVQCGHASKCQSPGVPVFCTAWGRHHRCYMQESYSSPSAMR